MGWRVNISTGEDETGCMGRYVYSNVKYRLNERHELDVQSLGGAVLHYSFVCPCSPNRFT